MASPGSRQDEHSSPHRGEGSRSPSYSPRLSNASPRPQARRSPSPMSRSSTRSPSEEGGHRRARLHGRSGSPEGQSRSSTALEVKGLTRMVFEQHLDQIFRTYGRIRSIHLPLSRTSGYNRLRRIRMHREADQNFTAHESIGVAYIIFETSASAAKALQHMDDGQIDGAIVRVRSVEEHSQSIRAAQRSMNPPSRRSRGAQRDERGELSIGCTRKRSRSRSFDRVPPSRRSLSPPYRREEGR